MKPRESQRAALELEERQAKARIIRLSADLYVAVLKANEYLTKENEYLKAENAWLSRLMEEHLKERANDD